VEVPLSLARPEAAEPQNPTRLGLSAITRSARIVLPRLTPFGAAWKDGAPRFARRAPKGRGRKSKEFLHPTSSTQTTKLSYTFYTNKQN